MISFQGFKPSGIEKIANAMGFQGEEKDFQKFLELSFMNTMMGKYN